MDWGRRWVCSAPAREGGTDWHLASFRTGAVRRGMAWFGALWHGLEGFLGGRYGALGGFVSHRRAGLWRCVAVARCGFLWRVGCGVSGGGPAGAIRLCPRCLRQTASRLAGMMSPLTLALGGRGIAGAHRLSDRSPRCGDERVSAPGARSRAVAPQILTSHELICNGFLSFSPANLAFSCSIRD